MMNTNRYYPLVNGTAHSWADIVVSIAKVEVVGIKSIKYQDEQEIEAIYGLGSYPIARGYGNIKATASIVLLRGTVEALRLASPTGRLQDFAPFDIIVNYIPIKGNDMFVHTIKNCVIVNDSADFNQGDVSNEVELTLLPSHILWVPEPKLVSAEISADSMPMFRG